MLAMSVVCIEENCCDEKIVEDENVVVIVSESIKVVSVEKDVIVVDLSDSENSVDEEGRVYCGESVLATTDE